jgi:hypothetical protein
MCSHHSVPEQVVISTEQPVHPVSTASACPRCTFSKINVKNGDAIDFDKLPWINCSSSSKSTGLSMADASVHQKRRLVESWLLVLRLTEQVGIIKHHAEHYFIYYPGKCEAHCATSLVPPGSAHMALIAISFVHRVHQCHLCGFKR